MAPALSSITSNEQIAADALLSLHETLLNPSPESCGERNILDRMIHQPQVCDENMAGPSRQSDSRMGDYSPSGSSWHPTDEGSSDSEPDVGNSSKKMKLDTCRQYSNRRSAKKIMPTHRLIPVKPNKVDPNKPVQPYGYIRRNCKKPTKESTNTAETNENPTPTNKKSDGHLKNISIPLKEYKIWKNVFSEIVKLVQEHVILDPPIQNTVANGTLSDTPVQITVSNGPLSDTSEHNTVSNDPMNDTPGENKDPNGPLSDTPGHNQVPNGPLNEPPVECKVSNDPLTDGSVQNTDSNNIVSDIPLQNIVTNDARNNTPSPTASNIILENTNNEWEEDNLERSRSEESPRSDDNVLITNKFEKAETSRNVAIPVKDKHADLQTIPVKDKHANLQEWIPIGSGKTLIHKDQFRKVNWKSYTIATRTLLLAAFTRRVLATHSLTGKKSPAFSDKPAKMCLDPKIVTDVIIEITEKFNVKENLVRSIITTKCADECKMYKTRLKKTSSKKNRENVPPNVKNEDPDQE